LNFRRFIGFLLLSLSARAHASPQPAFDLSSVRASADVTDITLKRQGKRWEIAITASKTVSFAGRNLPDGHRFYVDFPDCRLAIGEPTLALSENGVTVRAAQFSADPAIVRVVVQSEDGSVPALTSASPSDRALIALPIPDRSGNVTRIQISQLPPKAISPALSARLRSSARPASRSGMTSRGGSIRRPSPDELISPHDLLEVYDEPPVPSDGGSLSIVTQADLPDGVMAGVKAALAGNHRYVWGGETPAGFDCSGMTQFIYRYAGIEIPRTAREQFTAGTPVETNDLQPGDLVFFQKGKRIFHVALYLGVGRIFHAANPKRGLTTDLLSSDFYADHYAGARRFIK
jgi:cell wall-associated NlpC family hydrolase